MKINYDSTIEGYFGVPRSIIPGLVEEVGFSGLAKYLILVSQADFDSRHKTYSKIIRDDKTLAKTFKTSSSTFYKARKMLERKGFLILEDGISKVPSMDAFNPKILTPAVKKKISISTEMIKNWKLFLEEHQRCVEKMQRCSVQNKL